jgi:hypothetical protein
MLARRSGRAGRLLLAGTIVAVASTTVVSPARAAIISLNVDHVFGGPGASVLVASYRDCATASCPDTSVALSVTRGGTIIGSAGQQQDPSVPVDAQANDVVHISRDGVETASLTVDGRPTIDGGACAAVGSATISGSYTQGARLMVGASGGTGTITTTGDRYMASFPRPFAAVDQLSVHEDYSVSDAQNSFYINTQWGGRICPSAPLPGCTASTVKSNPSYLHFLKASVAAFARRWQAGAPLLINQIRACTKGRLEGRVTWNRPGHRPIVIASGSHTLNSRSGSVTLHLTPTGRTLKMHHRTLRAGVTIRYVDTGGGSVTHTIKATLRS